jgi:hypothetical protein
MVSHSWNTVLQQLSSNNSSVAQRKNIKISPSNWLAFMRIVSIAVVLFTAFSNT